MSLEKLKDLVTELEHKGARDLDDVGIIAYDPINDVVSKLNLVVTEFGGYVVLSVESDEPA